MEPLVLLQVIVGGLLLGGLYALAAAGLNLIFGVMRVINIAHGEFLMLGAYVAFYCWRATKLDPLIAVPVAMLVTGLLGLLVMRVVVRRVMRGTELTSLLATYGLSILLLNVSLYAFEGVFRSVPAWTGSIGFAGLTISRARGIAFVAAIILSLTVWLFLRYTTLGKAIRATAQHADVAMACGIDIQRVYLYTFALGAALAGAAGALLITFLSVNPSIGSTFILRAFAICVIGGLGSFPGALAGGLILGVAESLTALWTNTQIAEAVSYFLLIVVLLVRPQGLLSSTGVAGGAATSPAGTADAGERG
ncbi:MAG TPA: branched-chain amino acid ABC transporter permease [Chloroflexota bacterium]|nr:branched-chain amino acid ABC transporter permease [Chloroflexota bacterium]